MVVMETKAHSCGCGILVVVVKTKAHSCGCEGN